MGDTHGYGCAEHPGWDSIMVPVWMGWWLPDIHIWLHERQLPHKREETPAMTGQEAREVGTVKVPHCVASAEEQNRLAGLIADWVREHLGVEHVLFSTRYGLARTILNDGWWNDGYRKHPEPEHTEYRNELPDDSVLITFHRTHFTVEKRRAPGPWVPVGEGEQ